MDEESAVTKDLRAIHRTREDISGKLEGLTHEFDQALEDTRASVSHLVDHAAGTAQTVTKTVETGAKIVRALQAHPWGLVVVAIGALLIVNRLLIRARVNA
jgi:hypothetical protein